ncbi:hypothetical protein B0H17DRAFT_1185290 [Mycena rosella]|uniref:Uncharacterized protein n=1 Tax=Mycena rosella TaxID=1033263 RepID=A0AAD7G2Y5_MYCRO|nr:hypothetical protein B0H17DRAFT_1185290 [Mycena rosella]
MEMGVDEWTVGRDVCRDGEWPSVAVNADEMSSAAGKTMQCGGQANGRRSTNERRRSKHTYEDADSKLEGKESEGEEKKGRTAKRRGKGRKKPQKREKADEKAEKKSKEDHAPSLPFPRRTPTAAPSPPSTPSSPVPSTVPAPAPLALPIALVVPVRAPRCVAAVRARAHGGRAAAVWVRGDADTAWGDVLGLPCWGGKVEYEIPQRGRKANAGAGKWRAYDHLVLPGLVSKRPPEKEKRPQVDTGAARLRGVSKGVKIEPKGWRNRVERRVESTEGEGAGAGRVPSSIVAEFVVKLFGRGLVDVEVEGVEVEGRMWVMGTAFELFRIQHSTNCVVIYK